MTDAFTKQFGMTEAEYGRKCRRAGLVGNTGFIYDLPLNADYWFCAQYSCSADKPRFQAVHPGGAQYFSIQDINRGLKMVWMLWLKDQTSMPRHFIWEMER